ncbi:glycosyltransferase [Luteimonas lutimaris]|uniref:Glycosyltransferase n=1 Tax=Luteimonas lutimaris TaxID=698645 RepID=A0ABP7M775_9GAMM
MTRAARPVLLVLASTYPRWKHDHEPGFVHELAKRLTDHFRVLALVPHSPGSPMRETLDGVEVVRYRYAPERFEVLVNDGGIVTNLHRSKWKLLLVPTFVLSQAWQAWRLIRAENVDLIHAHWLLPQGLIAAMLHILPGRSVPFVVTSHGADLYALRGAMLDKLKRFVLRRASAATVVSGAMRERMRSMDVDVANVSVQPMGVDMEEQFTLGMHGERSQREILFVGRLVEKKGLRYLLRAMPHVLQQLPDATLTIAGFGPDEVELKAGAQALGIAESVHFLGAVPQSDLPELYRRAALFVAPFVRAASGDEEGLGLVLVEAIGCGCPVVVGDVQAMDELMGSEFRDLRINPRDTVQLASRIVEVLSNPDSARGRLEALREKIVARFDWREVTSRYRGLLTGVSCEVRK